MGYRREFLERLSSDGDLSESELLNIILSNANGGKDMSEVADRLLDRFPSVYAILSADIEEIKAVEGVTERVATYFKTLDRVLGLKAKSRLYINGSEECIEIAAERFRGDKHESAELYLLNKSGKVTDIKFYTSKNPDRVDMSATDIISAISNSGAYGLYFAHSHVNCPATPSRSDDDVTRKLITACDMCKIIFFDHCIVTSNGDRFSYLKSGRLEKLKIEVLNKR